MNLMENRKKGYVMAGLALGGLMLTGYLAIFVVPNALVTFSKAAPAAKVSLPNSYMMGGKMLAKADGIDKCVVNVFVVDANGRPVVGKIAVLEGLAGAKALNSKTDASGKIVFEVTSKKEGQFSLVAMVDGVPLPREIKVTFRN